MKAWIGWKIVRGQIEAGEALSATIGSIIDSSRMVKAVADTSAISGALAALPETSGIRGALANFPDTSALGSSIDFSPMSTALAGISGALAALPETSGIRGALANFPDTSALGSSIDFSPMSTALAGISGALAALPETSGIRGALANLNISGLDGILDSTRVATMLSSAIEASGITNAYSADLGILDTPRFASTLNALMRTPSFMTAVGGLHETLLSSSETRLDPSAGLESYETWTPRDLAPRTTPPVGGQTDEQTLTSDLVTESWIKRYSTELALAIAVLGVVVAVLAWLFPRSTPTPVQIKVVWSVVQSCLGTHRVVAPSHGPDTHALHQPADKHGSR